jgi:hypothetical protein
VHAGPELGHALCHTPLLHGVPTPEVLEEKV